MRDGIYWLCRWYVFIYLKITCLIFFILYSRAHSLLVNNSKTIWRSFYEIVMKMVRLLLFFSLVALIFNLFKTKLLFPLLSLFYFNTGCVRKLHKIVYGGARYSAPTAEQISVVAGRVSISLCPFIVTNFIPCFLLFFNV